MWVRLDDGMAHHPKFVRSGPEALAFFVAGLCYCNRYRTDGLIPKLVLPSLLPGLSEHRAMELALRLATNASRPSWIDVGDHYRVHDYEVYQPMRNEARDDPRRAEGAVSEGRCWGDGVGDDGVGDVTGYLTRDRHVDEGVTRYGNAAERYGNAPLPGPLPRSRPGPVKRELELSTLSTRGGWEGERERAKRAQNAARQRRFRERHAGRGGDVTRDVTCDITRYVTRNAPVTRDGNGPGVVTGAGPRPIGSGGEPPTAPSPEERELVRRAQNAERQRRFRRRQAARRAEAACFVTQDGNAADHAPVGPAGNGAARRRDAPPAGPVIPPGRGHRRSEAESPGACEVAERNLGADFDTWFGAYPRQEAEIPARCAWMAERELPPIALLLERLAVQKAAKPDAQYWLAPDRYLRERRWRDRPPPAPAVPARSVWAQLRAMGSDDGRRRRLREISAEARFDPFDSGASRG
jgi:hypothetical protein